jgi:hypothetical protein
VLTSQKKNLNLAKVVHELPEEKRLEQERLHDIHLLLKSLFEREEVTINLIINNLYDIGSVNLINKKITNQPLNWLMKWIARLAKPAFRIFALRQFKKKVPSLLTNWLHTKVKF